MPSLSDDELQELAARHAALLEEWRLAWNTVLERYRNDQLPTENESQYELAVRRALQSLRDEFEEARSRSQ